MPTAECCSPARDDGLSVPVSVTPPWPYRESKPKSSTERAQIVGSRLTEDQVEELLALIARHLRAPIAEATA